MKFVYIAAVVKRYMASGPKSMLIFSILQLQIHYWDKKILLSFKPDIVHIHNLYPFISPTNLVNIRRHHIPIVMTVHNYRLIAPMGFFTNGKICESCAGGKEWNCIIKNCEGSFAKSSGYALRNFYARKRKLYSSNVNRFICLTNFKRKTHWKWVQWKL